MKNIFSLFLFIFINVSFPQNDPYINSIWYGTYPSPSQSFDLGFTSNGTGLAAAWGFGMYFSVDNGLKWGQYYVPYPGYARIVEINPVSDEIYTATWPDGQLYKIHDLLSSWEFLLDGVVDFIFCSKSGTVFIRQNGSYYRSIDDGLNWENTQYLPEVEDYSGGIYSVIRGPELSIYKSVDEGVTWTFICSYAGIINANGNHAGDFAIDRDGVYYFTTSASTWTNFYRSMDNGLTWQQVAYWPTFSQYLDILIAKDNSVFVGGRDYSNGTSIYRTKDKGNTWFDYNNFPWTTSRPFIVQDLAMNGDGDVFAATSFHGIWRLPISVSGNIEGSVSINNEGLAGVTVKLLNEDGYPIDGYDDFITTLTGEYWFSGLPSDNYAIMLVIPLGYTVDVNPQNISLESGQTQIVNFDLLQTITYNDARGKGYWLHQFNVFWKGRGSAQETEEALTNYIDLLHQKYTSHFDLFSGVNSFGDFQNVLSSKDNQLMKDRAKSHLAALIFNLVSLKIAQYEIISYDSRTVADALTYISVLLTDNDESNDELAKNLAEMINSQKKIPANVIPSGSIVYKVSQEAINWNFSALTEYMLLNNYPNPFNPSTVISYQLPVAGFVSLKVFDILGNEMATLVNEQKPAGYYEIEFNASDLPSGVYMYRIQAGDFVETKKMLLLK